MPDAAQAPLVVPLQGLGLADARLAGHKAATLGALAGAGFPVPAGLVLTTAAFRLAVAPHGQGLAAAAGRDARDPRQAVLAAQVCADALAGLAVPPAVEAALRGAAPDWVHAEPLAVRSTATAEDRPEASFAGAYETVAGVRGWDALLAAVVACWRSFFAPGALLARAAAGLTGDGEGMAVLVQRLIDADCSGVCYTVDPAQLRVDTFVINAVWGMGVGAVDGSVAADTVWVRRDDLELRQERIVEKAERVAPAPDGSGLRPEPVPAEERRAACLPPPWWRRVAEFALAAEQLLERPQDVEWAISGQRVWVLQSRAITGLPAHLAAAPAFPVTASELGPRVPAWRRGRREAPPPLLLDVGAASRAAHVDSPLAHADEHVEEVRLFHGVPYSRRRPSDLREGDVRTRQAARREWGSWLRERDTTAWEHLRPVVAAAVRRLAAFDAGSADGPALAAHLEDAFGNYRHHWNVHWEMASLGNEVTAPFREAFDAVSGLSDKSAANARARVLHGEESEFTALIDRLHALGQVATQVPAVAAVVRACPPDAVARLRALPEAGPFLQALDALLDRYGDHSGCGYGSSASVETPTWREDPTLVLRVAAVYLDPHAEPPAAARARARHARDAYVEALAAGCADRDAVAAFGRWLPLARRTAADLENHNHSIDQAATGQLRAAILSAGRHLVAKGSLDGVADVFWMRRAEIVEALRAEASGDLRALVARRRAEHAAHRALQPPVLLGTPEAALEPRPPFQDEVTHLATREERHRGRISGQAASPGVVRARARVIADAALVPEIGPGDLLVAGDAGPLWTPLFPALGGLVLDRGALLQHAAAVAREYGVPAVIQTRDATQRIPDGARVTVDGTAGTVQVEAADGASEAAS